MPARTGQEYLDRLRSHPRDILVEGEHVDDVTCHPAFARCAQSLAALYDMQHDPELGDQMTYLSPDTGQRVGLSFITPKTKEDLEQRHTMMAN